MSATTCRDCGATWTGKRIEHCTSCHLTFTGTGAGDKHRTGAYFPNERHCLTPDEMRAKGMRQNERGHWSLGGDSPTTQCDGSCHDRDEDCRKCQRLVFWGRVVGCDDCLFYARQDA